MAGARRTIATLVTEGAVPRLMVEDRVVVEPAAQGVRDGVSRAGCAEAAEMRAMSYLYACTHIIHFRLHSLNMRQLGS